MSLLARLRARQTGGLATAIPAISATQPKGEAATVARIATVAVARLKEIDAADTGVFAHWRWRVVFADGSVKISAFTPPADLDEVKEVYPDAVSGQKIDDVKNQPGDATDF